MDATSAVLYVPFLSFFDKFVLERRGRELNPQILQGITIYKIAGLNRCPTSPHNDAGPTRFERASRA